MSLEDPISGRAAGKRSAYSHSGCVHCKRLRQKCDEKKPSCTACLNQRQECVYNQLIIMWTPQKKRTRAKGKGNARTILSHGASSSSSNSQILSDYRQQQQRQQRQVPQQQAQQGQEQSSQQHLQSQQQSFHTVIPELKLESDDDYLNADTGSSTDTAYGDFYLAPGNTNYHRDGDDNSPSTTLSYTYSSSGDESFLPEDFMSDIPAYRDVPVPNSQQVIEDETDYLNVPVLDDPPSPISDSVLLQQVPKWTDYRFEEWDRIMSAYRPSSFTTEYDLQRFLEHVFLRTKCAFFYPFAFDDNNPLWNGIMEAKDRHECLRYGMYTATCNILELHCKCSDWQPFRRKYLDGCMEALIKKVSSYHTNDEITALFTTSMVLCADMAASSSDKWRIHLRGALDLLRAWTESTIPSDLHVATRSWFAMADTLAWHTAPGGGATMDERYVDEILNDSGWVYLTKGLVIDGFNTIRGYSQLLVPHITRSARMMMEKHKYGFYAGDQDIIHSTLSEVAALEKQEFAFNEVSDPDIAKCMRYSHVAHCKALQLFIRVRLFGSYVWSPEVQTLTNDLLRLLQEYPLRKALGIGVHWAAFVTGRSCITIEQRSIIEKILVEMINIGLYWARNSLHRLLLYWEKYNEGNYDFDKNDLDSLTT